MFDIDAVTSSHILLWIIGAMTAVGLVGTVLAFWTMGRSAYRSGAVRPEVLVVDELAEGREGSGSDRP